MTYPRLIAVRQGDRNLPKAGRKLPKADRALPKADRELPKADRDLPKADRDLKKNKAGYTASGAPKHLYKRVNEKA